MEYLSLKDATTSYKVSDRTLRSVLAKLPTDERAKAVQSKGNKLFVSSEFLKARFDLRVPPPKVKRAKAKADATPEAKRVKLHNCQPHKANCTAEPTAKTSKRAYRLCMARCWLYARLARCWRCYFGFVLKKTFAKLFSILLETMFWAWLLDS